MYLSLLLSERQALKLCQSRCFTYLVDFSSRKLTDMEIDQILVSLLFIYFLFASDIATLTRAGLLRSLCFTAFSILCINRLYVSYLVASHPYAAAIIMAALLVVIIIVSVVKLRRHNLRRLLQKLRVTQRVALNRSINWIYQASPDECLQSIHQAAFSSVWNMQRVLFLSVIVFPPKLTSYPGSISYLFVSRFLIAVMVFGLLAFYEICKERLYQAIVAILLVPIGICLLDYPLLQGFGVEQLLIIFNLTSDVQAYGQLTKALIAGCLTSVYCLLAFVFWAIISSISGAIAKVFIYVLQLALRRSFVFSRQRRRAQRRLD